MKKVIIKNIRVSNFKGISSLNADFSTKGAIIEGSNEQGKSTLYDAYLWCLFGVTTRQNDCVQPIDENNHIVHKTETAVELNLLIDDKQDVKLTRLLSEKWKAQDTAGEKFVSAEQKRFYNDVPCSAKEYDAKISAIFAMDKWLMLSNIRTFMEQKMESRRDLLNQISSSFDENEIAKPYTLVAQAFAQGKTIVEYEKQIKDAKKRAENEIKVIPQKIAAQDNLRVEEDFDALRKEKENLDAQIADIDKQLQASPEELEAERRRKEELAKAENKYNELRKEWQDNHFKKMQELEIVRLAADEALRSAKEQKKYNEILCRTNKQKIATLTNDFEEKKKEWLTKNAEEFAYTDIDICPCCGHHLTEEEKLLMRNKAVNEYNTKKADALTELYNSCSEIKQRIKVFDNAITEYESNTRKADEQIITDAQFLLDDATKAKNEEQSKSIDSEKNIISAKQIVETLENAAKQTTVTDNKDALQKQYKTLQTRRDAIICKLSGERTNANVDKEKERLNIEAKKQAQNVADCDNALSQIRRYKKDVIDRTEASVNKYFRMVNWKFVEQNKTNDDEKQLCTPIYKGIEYNRQNYASQVNMGIDICEGIMRGFDVQLPLWVDNTESVCKLLDADTQIIQLRVVPDKELTINSL